MQKSIKTALFEKKIVNLNILNGCLPWNLYTSTDFIKKRDPLGHWKNGWIQTPQRILMDPCIKQAPVLSKRFWIIPWSLAYNRLDCIRKIINFWYTFGWKWWVFVTIWDCRTHVRMTSMTSSVEWTDLDFKISVALGLIKYLLKSRSRSQKQEIGSKCVFVFACLTSLQCLSNWKKKKNNNKKKTLLLPFKVNVKVT